MMASKANLHREVTLPVVVERLGLGHHLLETGHLPLLRNRSGPE